MWRELFTRALAPTPLARVNNSRHISFSVEQAIRARTLMSVAQLSQTASRRFYYQTTGVDCAPGLFIGFRRMSIGRRADCRASVR